MIDKAVELASQVTLLKSFSAFLGSIFLSWLGDLAQEFGSIFSENPLIVDGISKGLQWMAWGGASAVALVTVIKFLQDNGFIKKGKPKA